MYSKLFSSDLVHKIKKRRWLFTRSIEKVGLDRTERAGWLETRLLLCC